MNVLISKGISNFEINKFFENEENKDLKNDYMGVYSIDSIIRYINFYEIWKKENGKYPFRIFNADKHNKPGMHWWSFIHIHPKRNLLLFDSLRRIQIFYLDNDKAVIDELLYNFKRCKVNLTNQKLTLWTMKLWLIFGKNFHIQKKNSWQILLKISLIC